MSSLAVIAGVVVGVIIVLFILFKMAWRVAEPNEALVISGWGSNTPDGVAESLGFKIVTGKGTLVIPGARAVGRLRPGASAAAPRRAGGHRAGAARRGAQGRAPPQHVHQAVGLPGGDRPGGGASHAGGPAVGGVGQAGGRRPGDQGRRARG